MNGLRFYRKVIRTIFLKFAGSDRIYNKHYGKDKVLYLATPMVSIKCFF